MRYLLLILLSVAALATAACGSGGAATSSDSALNEPLKVDVCVEGEGRKAQVYFKNLGDFEWQDVEFSVTKGGETYTFLDEPQSKQTTAEKPTSWSPESLSPAYAFTDPTEFTRRGFSSIVRRDNYAAPLKRLSTFSAPQSATVEIGLPYEAEWTGEVGTCQ